MGIDRAAPAAIARAVFLDRDGTLNEAFVRDGKSYPPADVDEFRLLPGVSRAAEALKAAGYLLIVVTNQPDVGAGRQQRSVVEAMHAKLQALLPIDDIRVCYHTDADACGCRKPAPGMIRSAAAAWHIDLAASYMIGDRWRDVEAGRASGCRTVFIRNQYDERQPVASDAVVDSFGEAADLILSQHIRARAATPHVNELRVKLFADGADLPTIRRLALDPHIKGFTTNPTLMRKAAVQDYAGFAHDFLAVVPDRHISFEVFSDEPDEMERQALEIASWGKNVYVKVPVTNTRSEFMGPLLRRLTAQGVQVNVTAILMVDQVRRVADCLSADVASCVSVFAGRIADTGRDPVPIVAESVRAVEPLPRAEIIWASPRELLNVFQADAIGCHIITATADVLGKLQLVGKDLTEFSLDTVKLFRDDAIAAGYSIVTRRTAGPA